jgi:hypothetical protein
MTIKRTDRTRFKDAFDLWWEWAQKPLDSDLTIPAHIHNAVMTLTPESRRDRRKPPSFCAAPARSTTSPARLASWG